MNHPLDSLWCCVVLCSRFVYCWPHRALSSQKAPIEVNEATTGEQLATRVIKRKKGIKNPARSIPGISHKCTREHSWMSGRGVKRLQRN